MKRIGLQAQRRAQGSVCQLCAFSTSSISRRFTPFSPRAINRNSLYTTSRAAALPSLRRNEVAYRYSSTVAKSQRASHSDYGVREIISHSDSIISGTSIPSEESVINILKRSQAVVDAAQTDAALSEARSDVKPKKKDAISSLLELDDEGERTQAPQSQKEDPSIATSALSDMLNNLLQDPKVFISPEILRLYTSIQCQLKKADHIPTIFTLYANKPSPRSSGDTISYHPANPKSPKNAIPSTIADQALEVAMEQLNLPLALAIIDSAYCTPAFYRSKILRKASLPVAGMLATPPAAWAISTYLSTLQNTMDPSTARGISFAAILAYVTFTSAVGVVAAVTANDHMRRVVWIPGTALRHRWLREEERQALDRVAQTWGFKDPLMRGEEVGEEWEAIREFIGMRGMILDKTDHMEGME
ncbi:uncharacterized protein GIQ15_05554 [Arthroderma uncinatum]|uniref:uncharacterized protein n=1 Tax=Arthroderma uncinatum TaxID=74035 RepID=UPI00144AC817|nr:uncharacterized protein GIQ15_05554 [Arthroderma uncinatum]KAF3480207.1 hypothetical protein GIQ15_05554 [Arthroderma uncinatum]